MTSNDEQGSQTEDVVAELVASLSKDALIVSQCDLYCSNRKPG